MLDLSHINALKDQQVAVKESIGINLFQSVHTSRDHTFTHLIQCRSIILLSNIDLIEKSQGRTSTLFGFHALLMDSGHKNKDLKAAV